MADADEVELVVAVEVSPDVAPANPVSVVLDVDNVEVAEETVDSEALLVSAAGAVVGLLEVRAAALETGVVGAGGAGVGVVGAAVVAGAAGGSVAVAHKAEAACTTVAT